MPLERITVLPIPFDVAAWRSSLPPLAKEPLVLGVGHLYPRKNYRALLQACPPVRARRPRARLAIVGTGPEQEELEALAAAAQGAQLLGHVSFQELLGLYAQVLAFCHPSFQENFGISIVEGLASGCSVVTHHQPAALESTAGLPGTRAVDARQPEQLAQALLDRRARSLGCRSAGRASSAA